MKLFEVVGLFAFLMFVANCFQFEKARKICEKSNFESEGCKIHKELKETDAKKSSVVFK